MAKITIKNVSTATLRGVKPGQTAQVDDEGPIGLYWRKRIADRSVVLVVESPAPPPPTPADPVSRPAAKKQKD